MLIFLLPLFSVLVKILAGKNISKMANFMWSGTDLNSLAQSINLLPPVVFNVECLCFGYGTDGEIVGNTVDDITLSSDP